MLSTDEVWFIPHCDEPSCSFGRTEYECPSCRMYSTDYGELWFGHEKIYSGGELAFECEKCKEKLVLRLDDDKCPVVTTRS